MQSFWQTINPKGQDNIQQSMALLYRMRWVAIIGQVLLGLIAQLYFNFIFPFEWMLSIIGFEAILQITTALRIHRREAFPQFELFLHLIIDSLFLAGLVFLSGGVSNPFTYLLLLPIALGTFMLKPNQLLMLAVLESLLYSFLHFNHVPLAMDNDPNYHIFNLHMAGMWVNFGLSALLLAFFGLAARKIMVRQGQKIQQLREKQLKDEQLLSLGIMSASATHELGTPLATMAIIADDMSYREHLDVTTREDLNVLQDQINRCKEIIDVLGERSSDNRQRITAGSGQQGSLNQQLEKLINDWSVYRPQIQYEIEWRDDVSHLPSFLSISVEQAITNLLDNAAEASLENNQPSINIQILLNTDDLIVQILDSGTGISEELMQQLGNQLLDSEKESGMGWGHFLSNASIERAGGSVNLAEQDDGGILTRITIPFRINDAS